MFPLCPLGYEIIVVTGSVNFAGTDAGVFITLYGKKGASEKLALTQTMDHRKPFKKGAHDCFFVETDDVGEMTRVRIEHNNRGTAPGWYLDHIEVKELDANDAPRRSWRFNCNQWIATDEGDGLTYKDLNAVPMEATRMVSSKAKQDEAKRKDEILQVDSYEILVATGNENFGGTDANVFLTMFGNRASSSKLPLGETISRKKPSFEKAARDVFSVRTKPLGELEKIRVEHDNTGTAPGWFLDFIEIKALNSQGSELQKWRFDCQKWLATDKDDRKLYKELYAKCISKPMLSDGPLMTKTPFHQTTKPNFAIYEVIINTGSSSFAGNDVNIFIQFFGTTGKSNEIWFPVGKSGRFDKGTKDKLCVSVPNSQSFV